MFDFGNQNLVAIRASSTSKFVTKVMERMFTKEELARGYWKDENSKSRSQALDKTKIDLLQGKYSNKS